MTNRYSTLRRLALTALLSGGVWLGAQAQTLGQLVTGATNVAGTYNDLGTTGTAIATANTDDANSAPQNIGFSFGFNGTVFTQFVLNTNGAIRLGSAAPSTAALYFDNNSAATTNTDPLQSTSAANTNLLLPFNFDLVAGSGGAEYRVATTGAAGSRVCTIQWKNVADKAGAGSDIGSVQQYSNFSFQVKLYEANGAIEFVYGAATASAGAASTRYVNAGLKGSGLGTGQLLLAYKTNAAAWSTTAFRSMGYAANTHDISNAALPDAGRTYRFTDPTYCVPGIFSAPYAQNFDGVTAPALPCGITVLDANGDGNTWVTNSGTASSAPNAMRAYSGGNVANDWFFTNALNMTAGMSYQLQFKYRSSSATNVQGLEVKVGAAATPAGQTTTVFTNTNITNATYATTVAGSAPGQVVLFTPTTSGVYYFGFHSVSAANQLYLYVDDVAVAETVSPACPQPSALAVSGITTTGATVSFTGPTNGSAYTVIYGPRGFTPPSGTGAQSVSTTATSLTLSGLSSNTNYDVYVQATCGSAGTSVLTGPISFLTACATTTTFPYLENFDGVTAPALPCGITVLDANNDGKTWANMASTPNSTPNAMRYTYSTTSPANDWFFTNALSLRAGMSYQLQFKYRAQSAGLPEGLEVKVGTAATPAGQTTTVFTNTSITNTTYATTVAGSLPGQATLFTPTTSGVYYFGFHAISATNQFYLFVDDIAVTEAPTPACSQPSTLAMSGITATGATVSFTGPTNGSAYTVIYGPRGFTPPSGTGAQSVQVTTATATLTGLTSNTNYDVYVQATCGSAGTSVLTGPISFLTACATTTTFPYLENFDGVTAPALPCGITVLDANNDGKTWANMASLPSSTPNAMRYTYSTTSPADDWFFTNALSLRAGMSYQLQFKYRSTSTANAQGLEVKVGTAATPAGQTTTVFTNTSITDATYATTVAGSLPGQVTLFTPTTSGVYYFGFHGISLANRNYLYVDDIAVTEVPTPACPQPSALAVSNITDTGATVTFAGPATGTAYTIVYGPSGFDPTTGGTSVPATTSPIVLTGLSSFTGYCVYVRATCGTAGTSVYTGPVCFNTACTPASVFPYRENFDGVTAPALPCGVTVLDANNDGKTWVNTAVTPSSAPNAMRYTYNLTGPADDWFYTNALRLEAGSTYQLQFKYSAYSATFPEGLEVKVGAAATPAGQTTTVFTNTNITNTTYATTTAGTAAGQVASFTPTTSGIYYFGFHAISTTNQYYLFVDDVSVDQTSRAACPTPSALAASNITSSGATVAFTGPTQGTTWKVSYVPTGTPLTASSPFVTTTTLTAALTNLSANTGYDVYVQATCGTAGTSIVAGPLSFVTACAMVTAYPYTENFDGVTSPALPCGITTLDANADGSTWLNETAFPNSAPNAMRYTASGLNAADDWFFTAALTMQAGSTYQLQFKHRAFSVNYPEGLEVKVGPTATPAGQTTTVFYNAAINNTAYVTTSAGLATGQVARFTPTTSGTYYFGFHAFSRSSSFYIFVDDVSVTATTPTGTKSSLSPGFHAEASPVPFGERLTLTLNTLTAGPLSLTLHDAVGRVVRQTTATVPAGASSLAVPNVQALPAGIYLLTVRQGGNTQVIRVAHE